MLHTYSDGSTLKLMSAKELITIPIWKGQRILDKEHAASIKSAVGSTIRRLDSGYSIVRCKEEATDGKMVECTYLIDGQHRASVIRDWYAATVCEPDFHVTVTEKVVESESDIIHDFNKINTVKPQQWKVDPAILANNYIAALERAFNTNKKCPLIRTGSTTRPFLACDALRKALLDSKALLKYAPDAIAAFVSRVQQYNVAMLGALNRELVVAATKDSKLKERAIAANFALAYDTKLQWVAHMLTED